MSDPDATPHGNSEAIPPTENQDAGARPGRASAVRRRRWPWIVAGLVAVVLIAGIVAARTSVNYFVITPGDATPVSQYIQVPQEKSHPLTGKILLTDVFVSQLNALTYLRYRYLPDIPVVGHLFASNFQLYSGAELLGPATNQGEFLNQGFLQMAQAQSFATASALKYLGYMVSSANAGALVYGIEPHSPASNTLQLGQVIKAVNGTPTSTACGLVDALHGLQPGTTASLTVERSYIDNQGALVPGPTVQKSVTLAKPPKGLVENGCGPPSVPTVFLGIVPQDQQNWHFPVSVTINTPQIGGPSAGLAMTLGIIDKLGSGRLTGQRVVAATGTMDQYGNVGQVGGVPEKTVAVENAGATVFFVPKQQLGSAEAKATPPLHVYGVSTLDQALTILKRLGGTVPSTPAPA